MSSVFTNRAEMSKKSYIAAQDFTGHLWSYATTRSQTTFVVTGSLTAQTGGSYPKGAVLHETGKRLFPGANPGVTTMMVGVFNSDVVPALSGFIDPNSKYFTTFSIDKPVTIPNGYDQDDSTNLHSGQPVITNGSITAGGQVRCGTVTALPATGTATAIDGTLSQVYTITANSITPTLTITGASTVPGAAINLIVTGDGTARVITFGTGFKPTGTLTTAGANNYTLTFISNGTSFFEVSRTAAIA
uniref:Uncharacterized protein n=1 Tax=viral metagenome TaxID=1070528 RepID=A0A6C0DN19_9ZZZZ